MMRGGGAMPKLIAYCGLVCSDCPAYKATQSGDPQALAELAAQWSKEFKEEIAPDACLCDGCLPTDGRLVGYASQCKIRPCAIAKKVKNCGHCADYACDDLTAFFAMAPRARTTLEGVRRAL
jgi:hypothetical protein